MADRTFAKFTFFKLDPAWQRRDPEARAEDKREFLAACEDYALDRSLRAYSTVGTRGDTDLMLLAQSPVLADIHTFHVVLAQSGLAKWMSIPHSYLAMTKPLAVLDHEARPEICAVRAQVLHRLPARQEARVVPAAARGARRVMREHIEIGRRYPEITINTAYSSASTTRSSWSRSSATTRATSSTWSRSCAARVERLHPARHADLHLRGDVGRPRPRRPRRRRDLTRRARLAATDVARGFGAISTRSSRPCGRADRLREARAKRGKEAGSVACSARERPMTPPRAGYRLPRRA